MKRRRALMLAVGASLAVAATVTAIRLHGMSTVHRCALRGSLPDSICTPGVVDPTATLTKVCTPGYTAIVRPPATYTNALKTRQMAEYGLTGKPADYEEDHLISLELGGDPRDPRNLFPEPRRSIATLGAEDKDAIENALHRAVCVGRIPLAEAQRRIATDWTRALP